MAGFIYQYVELIKENFDEEKIIITELFPCERYIDSNGSIITFAGGGNIPIKNRCMELAYEMLENAEELAEEYEVSSIPCLVLFENGKETKRKIGLMSKDDIEEIIGG